MNEPITTEDLQRVFRATGFLTNGQAWDIAELVRRLLLGDTLKKAMAQAEAIRKEAFGD